MRTKILFSTFFSVVSLSATAQSQIGIEFLEKIKAYKDSVKTIRLSDPQRSVDIDSLTFDVATYRKFYDRLKLPNNQKLQYWYDYRETEGLPLLFVTDSSFNLEQYAQSILINDTTQNPGVRNFKKNRLIAHIVTDSLNSIELNFEPEDSKDGFLQYLYLCTKGNFFAYHWHAYYAQNNVITSKKNIANYCKYYALRKDDFNINLSELKKLQERDLYPKIYLVPDFCIISWYEIWIHNGIFKVIYTIKRHKPHTIREVSVEKILPVEPNFIY